MDTLSPDPKAMLVHLKHLFGDQPEGLVELAWTPAASDQITEAALFPLDHFEDLVESAVKLNGTRGVNCYIGAALRHPETDPTKRTCASDVFCATAYWADVDKPGTAEQAEQLCNGALPSFTVITGQHPHLREQLYWRCEEPIDLAGLVETNTAIRNKLHGDNVQNADRVLRLTGSIAWPKKRGRRPEKTEILIAKRPLYMNGEVPRLFPKMEQKTSDNITGFSEAAVIPDGHRQSTLPTLAGYLVKSMPFEQARLFLHDANMNRCKDADGNPAPLPATDIDSMIRRIWEREAGKSSAVPCIVTLADWTVESAYTGLPPLEDPVVTGLFMNRTTVVEAAIGGAGKTDTGVDLGTQVVTNENGDNRWLGYPVNAFGSVVMLAAEDNRGSVHQRIHKVSPMLDSGPFKSKLMVVPIPEIPGIATLIDKDAQPTDLLRSIGDQIGKIGDVRIFIPDPLRTFVRADVNADPEMAAEVLRHFNAFAAQHDLLVLLTHHLAKRGINATTALEAREAIQGVSAIVDHARAAFALWMPKKETTTEVLQQLAMRKPTEPAFRVFYAALVKANHPHADYSTRTLVRTDGDRLVDFTAKLAGEEVEELTADQYDSRLADLLDHIRQRADSGRPFKNSNRHPDGIFHKSNLDRLTTNGKRIGNLKDIDKLIDSLALRDLIRFVSHGGGAKQILPMKSKPG